MKEKFNYTEFLTSPFAISKAIRKWSQAIRNWGLALNRFSIIFADRVKL